MAVLAPEAPKAATLTAEGDLAYFSFPIEKVEDGPDGEVTVIGKATDGTLDSDLQIVDPEWSEKALREWFETGGNVRVQHQAQRDPAGKGIWVSGHQVRARVVEPVAVKLVKAGVLQDFSVGIMNPDIRRGDPRFRHLDPQGKAVNGVITGRDDGLSKIGEVSLVDRGSNFGTKFAMLKAAADGSAQWTGELTAPDEVLAKVATPDSGLTTVELPSDMKLKLTPVMLAKMATFKRDLVLREQAMKAATADVAKTTEPDAAKADLKDSERAGMPAGDFAYVDPEGGKHLPVHDEGHVRSALGRFAQQHFDSPTAKRKAAKKIVSRARGMGIDLADHGTVVAAAGKVAAPGAVKNGDDDKLGQCPTCKGRGFTKKPANQKCEACGGSGRATGKAAEPDIAKCMKCSGTGMVGKKPCTDCKDGKKAAAALIAKKKGKMRAVCPNCGAKQNPDHKHCPECGNALPERAIQVKKNHDFVCLGCGNDLDKGEPHCPECGKENPGYLPEADRKIPANEDADKAAKERVSSNGEQVTKGKGGRRPKGGKKMPFGGNQAKPFGAKDTDDDDKPDAKAEKRRKGGKKGGKGRSPAGGVTAQETAGLPPHREPVPAATQAFEEDLGKAAGDEQMQAAIRHKSLAMPPELALLHDLTCPAFSPEMTGKAFPGSDFAGFDPSYWQQEALKAAGEPDIAAASAKYNEMAGLSRAAMTLKTADPQLLHDLRTQSYQAFFEANKAYRDATPGPGSFPTPGNNHQPGSFRRPYLSAGHAAASPQYEPARTFPVISEHPAATDFQRGYISGGHADQSPDNAGPQNLPDMRPASVGQPANVPYAGTMRDNAQHSLSAMHDHLSRRFPDVCPMSPEVAEVQKPGRPVGEPVGGPVPHGIKASKADRAASKAAAKAKAAKKAAVAAKRKAARQRKQERAVAKAAQPYVSPVTSTAPGEVTYVPPAATLTADDVTAAVKAAQAPLLKRIARQEKTARKTAKLVAAIGDQPDTSQAPFRGAGSAYKASAAPAAPQTVAEAAALAQATQLQQYASDWRNSPDPDRREMAWKAMTQTLGINAMPTSDPTKPVPYHPQR